MQGEDDTFKMTIRTTADTLSEQELQRLRILITLKNNYPGTIKSVKYYNFVECLVFRDGLYFYTIENPRDDNLKTLKPVWSEIFPADTSITALLYVDIAGICKKKKLDVAGEYSFQGSYSNYVIDDDPDIPVWTGSVKSKMKKIHIY